MYENMDTQALEFDVVIVGGGPAGLSAACRLAQAGLSANQKLSICLLEKGPHIGAHIISGALFDPMGLDELFPDWQDLGAPVTVPVTHERFYYCPSQRRAIQIPSVFIPPSLNASGCFIISLGDLCQWLAKKAVELGVEIFEGFGAESLLFDKNGTVSGVRTGAMGVGADGTPRSTYCPGTEIHAATTLFAEGARGHLGQQLIHWFELGKNTAPQHYALGLVERWQIQEPLKPAGHVVHGMGWPLTRDSSGGFFLYQSGEKTTVAGMVVDLDYANPHLNPYQEFQRLKHHPLIANRLAGGKRVAFGARVIAKGGEYSRPVSSFPGGALLGCAAGTLNPARNMGIHTAMKSGMVAADIAAKSLLKKQAIPPGAVDAAIRGSWIRDELYASRNFYGIMSKWGKPACGLYHLVDQKLFNTRLPFRIVNTRPDRENLNFAVDRPLNYPKPDHCLTFDIPESLMAANLVHPSDQPCHIKVASTVASQDRATPESALNYCPGGVFSLADQAGAPLMVSPQNCLHCKTCDIKDPFNRITWSPPEGGSGPRYAQL